MFRYLLSILALTYACGGKSIVGDAGTRSPPPADRDVGTAVEAAYEVVTCTGAMMGSDGVDVCTLDPNKNPRSLRSSALSDCDRLAGKIDTGWFFTAAKDFRPYVGSFVGTCP